MPTEKLFCAVLHSDASTVHHCNGWFRMDCDVCIQRNKPEHESAASCATIMRRSIALTARAANRPAFVLGLHQLARCADRVSLTRHI